MNDPRGADFRSCLFGHHFVASIPCLAERKLHRHRRSVGVICARSDHTYGISLDRLCCGQAVARMPGIGHATTAWVG
jgi:hypothetical protein